MHAKIFRRPNAEARHRSGLFGEHFDCFNNWMQEHGYALGSMKNNIFRATNFGEYLKKRGIRTVHAIEGEKGQKFLRDYRRYCKTKGHIYKSKSIGIYLQALQDIGVLKAPAISTLFNETKIYKSFLKERKGLTPSTIRYRVDSAEKFLRFLGCRSNDLSLPDFGIAEVDRFIEGEGARLSRTTNQLLAGSMRCFLRFLHQSGKLDSDLSRLVTSPRCYKLESLPRVLDRGEIKKILRSVDMSTKSGLRHYAILLLLTTYGLRASEVARLNLEDIDWRKETIHIAQSKTGKDLWLPLVPRVGNAIVAYLKRARPSSRHRQVFLLTCAPWKPLTSSNIGYTVRQHVRLAGIDAPHSGPHMLRHSFATDLMRRGVSLKQIGDLLGHRLPESTHIYTKTATDKLREVALEVPEVQR